MILIRLLAQRILPLLFAAMPLAHAGNLSIANEPLSSGAKLHPKPNLMFILDDSGSMESDYMPDYVSDSRCAVDYSGSLRSCQVGDPPFSSSGYNTLYYNPTLRYQPPKKGDLAGSDWGNASTTAPLMEPFDGLTTTQSLSAYPDAAWCKNSSDKPTGTATDSNCVYYQAGVAFNYPTYPNGTYQKRVAYKAAQPYYYTLSGNPLWCTDSALTKCVSRRNKNHTYPRFTSAAAMAAVTGVAAYRTFYVVQAGPSGSDANITINSITYNGTTNILTAPVAVRIRNNAAGRNALADAIIAKVGNGFVAKLEKYDTGKNNCSDSKDSLCPQIRITAPGGSSSTTNTSYNGKSLDLDEPTDVDFKLARDNLSGGVDYVPGPPAFSGVTFTRVEIKAGSTYTKYPKRTDCVGSSCTGAEELQNFANWYSYYRKRISMTKSAMSLAFSSVSDTSPGAGLRVGLMTISAGASSSKVSLFGQSTCWNANKALELPIGDFNQTQKTNFYTNLFKIQTCSMTPLRGALSRAGKLYAGKLVNVDPVHSADPVQYSCQSNFTLLSTDGYWNAYLEDTSFGPIKEDGISVGDQDVVTASPPTQRPQLDVLGKPETLADVAMYYYKNDLRPTLDNDVETTTRDPSNKQHMTTFTMGLGVDGTLAYSPEYETGGSADYNAIVQGTKDWPDPIGNAEEERIDDLWHAAVNGRGKYFSAGDPDTVVESIKEALKGAASVAGASAAAATSNLEPIAGDNYAYVASYTTETWEGNLEAKTIDLGSGALSADNVWSAQALLDTKAVLGRTIYKFDATLTGTDKKKLMTWANLNAAEALYFDPAQLSQCKSLADCPGATSQNLFNYLKGGADTTTNRSYRRRAHVLGDIVSSQPVYVKAPPFAYTDAGYGTFKTTHATTRQSTVYVAANDGFLHALNGLTGEEMWAYAPTAVLPNLYQLANTNYEHRYYVDGSVVVGDIKSGTTWKTLLVGGLNAGGKSYYAMDVTDPANPQALWEFTDPRLGYSYGNPIITKLQNGTWVVLVTSGYNNGTSIGSHDGQGVLYVLNAATGAEISRVYTCTIQSDDTTCSGSSSNPNGLAKINNWVENSNSDNTTKYVYGGDLNGDIWRFDINATSPVAIKVAALAEPITTRPELAEISGKRVMFFGTGLFLQGTDKSDRTKRSVYGVKDCMAATCATLTNVKVDGSGFIKQTLMPLPGDANSRTMTALQSVNWNTDNGWFVELYEAGERVNVDLKLQLGTLVVAANVPEDTGALSCTSGGSSWLYFLDITNGGFIVNSQSNPSNIAGTRIGSSLAVGTNIVKLPNGKLITIVTTSDNKHPVFETPVSSQNLAVRRVSWRELITD
jgi:type IV pilus assembly protein PilY1